jgi:hypothetical protein
MTVRVAIEHVQCPGCGYSMGRVGDETVCMTPGCKHYRQRFKTPKQEFELVPVEAKKKP